MRNSNSHGQDAFNGSGNGKDKKNYAYLKFIRREVAKKLGLTFEEFLLTYSNAQRYFIGLEHFTTTNKAICEALFIPVEAGTRYKAKYHKKGLLAVSVKRYNCHFTTEKAHYYTTDKSKFNSKDFLI